MPGLVVTLDVEPGQAVRQGEAVAVIEAMKMQNIIRAERDGVVKTVSVKAGDSVTWTNAGKEVHTPTARDGSWTAGPIQPGQSATVKFDRPGTYIYADKDHLWSVGQLIVE